MDIKTYTDALTRQQADLQGDIAGYVSAIPVPAGPGEEKAGDRNFLTTSGWVFNVLGIIAFIAGLTVGSTGLWITGCASLLSGCYCIVKGKQQLRREAHEDAGDTVLKAVDRTVAHVSKTWTDFVSGQNASLRRDIVTSDMDTDDKVRSLGLITDSSYLHVDMKAVGENLTKIDVGATPGAYKTLLGDVQTRLYQAVDVAAKAQADIYAGVAATSGSSK